MFFLHHFKIWPPSYQKEFYWRTVWCTKIYPIFHKVVRLKPADSLSKWFYAPKLWDVKYFMASAGDVMAGTVLTNDPRCSRCQPEIGGAARKTTRDARYDSRGKLSQRRGTGGWNVSLLQFRHLLFSITISLNLKTKYCEARSPVSIGESVVINSLIWIKTSKCQAFRISWKINDQCMISG